MNGCVHTEMRRRHSGVQGIRVNSFIGKHGTVELESSQAVENERRLFYMALTRAHKVVYIGTAASPKSLSDLLPSRFLDELQLTPTV